MNPLVDEYFADAKRWREESQKLRAILLDCGLREALKWGKPCYAFDGKNIAIIQKMSAFLALMFFKGALLSDPQKVLESQGENSRAQRRLCFTNVAEVIEMEALLRGFVREAIKVERDGLTLGEKPELVLVEELQARLDDDLALRAAFEALTPGRQRAYNLYFSGAKQTKTRAARVEKVIPQILAGKGFGER